MRGKLKALEKLLQDFFENQIQALSGKDLYREITEIVFEKLHQNIYLNQNKKFAPNIFRISIKRGNPISRDELEIFSETLKEIIKRVGQDESLNFPGPLHIQFYQEDKIQEKIKVDIAFSSPPSDKTKSIMTAEVESKHFENKVNGYLITPTDHVFEIKNKVFNIGRKDDNELVMDNLLISRLHAQIREINGKHILFDIDSTSGTKINGNRIRQQALISGDVIDIADISLIYYTELDESLVKKQDKLTKKI